MVRNELGPVLTGAHGHDGAAGIAAIRLGCLDERATDSAAADRGLDGQHSEISGISVDAHLDGTDERRMPNCAPPPKPESEPEMPIPNSGRTIAEGESSARAADASSSTAMANLVIPY